MKGMLAWSEAGTDKWSAGGKMPTRVDNGAGPKKGRCPPPPSFSDTPASTLGFPEILECGVRSQIV